MNLVYRGTGTVTIEGYGPVKSGEAIVVSEAAGRARIKQDPKQWSEARPAAKKQAGRGGAVSAPGKSPAR